MKFKRHTIFLISSFLLATLLVYGAGQSEETDKINTQKILVQLDSIRQILQPDPEIPKPKADYLVYPKVVGYGALLKTRPANFAVFNDYIYLKIDSIAALLALTDSITGNKKDTMGDLILYINGNAMRDLVLVNIDKKKQTLVFQLDRHSKYLMKFYPEFSYLWSKLPVFVTAGFKNGMMLPVDPALGPLFLAYVSSWSIVVSLLFILTIIVIFIVLAAKTNLIRIGDDRSPFSLALTQLSFWSIVIASSFLYIWIVTDELPPMTGSTLILLSVSALTTAGSRLVDIRADSGRKSKPRSDSFLEDILKDELGYSVHRAQMFMWTVILGVIFVSSVIRFQQIPQLDESLLGLMGISSGAYVGLKTMENKNEGKSKAE